MAARAESQRIVHAAANVRRWPAALAYLLLGAAYALVSDRLTLGPPWWLLVLAVAAIVGARVLRWRGLVQATRWVVIGSLAAVTLAITVSAGYLVDGLLNHTVEAGELLRAGALLWGANVLTFALWYWEMDAGGPNHRHLTHCGSTDFAFPQRVIGGELEATWVPEFIDYVFLAFNTSTAFSPTDTMVLARRAKVMMMYQSIVSLTTVVVLVARAIKAI